MRIAVIGAGPAGSRAAARLVSAGHDVLLIDRTFDREKPCGGGVPWVASSAPAASSSRNRRGESAGVGGMAIQGLPIGEGLPIRRVVFESLDHRRISTGARNDGPVPERAKDGERVPPIAKNGDRASGRARLRTAEVVLPRPVMVFSRRTLDRALVEQARACGSQLVRDGVVSIERADGAEGQDASIARAGSRAPSLRGRWRLALASGGSLLADHIVGADGARSLVRRTLGSPFSQDDLSQAVGWYVPGARSDTMTIRFDPRVRGYMWSFPRTDHLAVGACAPLAPGIVDTLWEAARGMLETAAGFGLGRGPAMGSPELTASFRGPSMCEGSEAHVDEHGPAPEHRTMHGAGERLPRYSALIPSLGLAALRANRVAGPGWSLVGDAAGTVDPLTREGIRHGLLSADLLADAFEAGIPDTYESRWRGAFLPEFSWAAAKRARFFDPDLTSRLVRYLSGSRAIRRVMVDLILGAQDYPSLKRRLVRTAVPAGFQLGIAKARAWMASNG